MGLIHSKAATPVRAVFEIAHNLGDMAADLGIQCVGRQFPQLFAEGTMLGIEHHQVRWQAVRDALGLGFWVQLQDVSMEVHGGSFDAFGFRHDRLTRSRQAQAITVPSPPNHCPQTFERS